MAALFHRIVRWRLAIVVGYAALVPVAGFLALRIPTDNAIDRMIVESDADYAATRAFRRVFPEPPTVLLLAEVDDPFRPESLASLRALETALSRVPRVRPISAIAIAERLRPGLSLGPSGSSNLRRFLTGTSFFRRQALLGDHFLGLALRLDVQTPAERDAALVGIEPAIAAAGRAFRRVRRVGDPFVSSYLERQTREASARTSRSSASRSRSSRRSCHSP